MLAQVLTTIISLVDGGHFTCIIPFLPCAGNEESKKVQE